MTANIAILTLPVKAAGTLVAHRFVADDGNHAAAGETAIGVTRTAAVKDEIVPVDVQGTGIVEAGGTFAAGDPLAVGADGKAVKAKTPGYHSDAYDTGDVVVARALETGGSGALVEVLLIANASMNKATS